MNEDLYERRYQQAFDIRRSIRYHSHRRAFYDRMHKGLMFVGVVGGSATLAMIVVSMAAHWVWLPPLLVTLATALDLVWDCPAKMQEHGELLRRFTELEKRLLREEVSEALLKALRMEQLDIEVDEPQPLHVLNTLCYNETMTALGHSANERVRVSWPQRLCAPLFDLWPERLQLPRSC